MTVANGEGTFTLKDGETLTIYGIPEGTAYTVMRSVETYTASESGRDGGVVSEETMTATGETKEVNIGSPRRADAV